MAESQPHHGEPFQFVAASYLVHIRRERARCLGELEQHLRDCSPESIFYHTFQSIKLHHYARFSSDFAQWIMAACNEAELSERIAAVDVRDYVSIEDLRAELVSRMDEFLDAHPESKDRPAFEPFHFCEAVEVTVGLESTASNLAELAEGIQHLSVDSLHYHFINSRLRLQLRTNDFSNWIETSLGLPGIAQKINHIDFYANSLEGVRQEIVQILEHRRAA